MNGNNQTGGFRWSRLFQYFLQGLLVLAPVTITAYTIYWIVSSIDSLVPLFTARGADGQVYVRNYGLGFLVVIVTVCLIGFLSTYFLRLKLFGLFDSFLERTPGVRLIYSTVKDFFEAFAGEKKKFNRPVLASVDDTDVWRVGFITRADAHELGLDGYVAVYVPMSYSIAGNVYILPPHRIKPINRITASETMKFAISGGVTNVEESKRARKDIY
ncbi:Uncharacterized membrane protein [Cnuella takakiae]|uniref:Uncharacterized membrane protein n=1 Tax=Cnuella takakiae TaxID=1302690 RepID=A0A1M5ERX9_9BACT|nr:DUF502 domain-containing protein [Cnuella takakiae]OLY91276.1 hypothetical protein BUE76_04695 [Cnuella takakiae]SHF81906.1 Uncharacterized membrane protein [Cnuella takakiae]